MVRNNGALSTDANSSQTLWREWLRVSFPVQQIDAMSSYILSTSEVPYLTIIVCSVWLHIFVLMSHCYLPADFYNTVISQFTFITLSWHIPMTEPFPVFCSVASSLYVSWCCPMAISGWTIIKCRIRGDLYPLSLNFKSQDQGNEPM